MTLAAGTRMGRYAIHSLLGAGGMGEVYLAEDTRLRRKVALKLLQASLTNSPERLKRFEQEAVSASALNHPNIITIYEIGEEQGTHFIATEFIDGETLRQLMTSRQIEWGEVLDISLQLASALTAAHTAGIVHRDIKPENIMVRHDRLVKVLDFGLVKLNEVYRTNNEDLTLMKSDANMIMGTVPYMSPEQARGHPVDERTDVWSFGVVLYEMLAMRVPFMGDNLTDILISIVQIEPPPLRTIVPDAPDELLEIVSRTLCKNPAERYQTISAVQADLRPLKQHLNFGREMGSVSTAVDVRKRVKAQDRGENGAGEYATQMKAVAPQGGDRSLHANNLSQELTPLVGRTAETEAILKMLRREDVRLVTLTGIGGTGKTRLAKAVARAMLREFADGVFFIDLAPISDAELVATAIAKPLGIQESGSKSLTENLKDVLKDKRLLLLLDNFEQVTDAASLVKELLSTTHELKVLATSRVPLWLAAEHEFGVPPLELPSASRLPSVKELAGYSAIALFIERAQTVKPMFQLTDENASSVAEICARLDGLPLAIELAAVRVKLLSPQAILTRLENRLKLLTGGARDLPARQQTMRSAIAWSYDLLEEDEKRLLNRLAVFAGGSTIESAEEVCGTLGELKIEVMDGISSLANKSLLVQKEQTDGESRFRMLAVVHEYANECLQASGELDELRRLHAGCFLALAERAEPELQDAQQAEWFNRLEEDHDNLRAAVRWSTEHDAETALRLAGAIYLLWVVHGHLTEGRRWLETALSLCTDAPAPMRWKALVGIGTLARLQGDYQSARKFLEQSLLVSKEAKDKQQVAKSSNALGLVYLQGDLIAARTLLEDSLAIGREVGDQRVIGSSLNILGEVTRIEGDYATARTLYEGALTSHKQAGNTTGVITVLINLGVVAYFDEDYEAARSYNAQALSTAQELGHKPYISLSLAGFAALAMKRGDLQLAARLSGAADRLREAIGYQIESADCLFHDTYIADLRAALGEESFTATFDLGRALKMEQAIASALEQPELA
jgi:predicted ATPase/serine/threonine protein kinase